MQEAFELGSQNHIHEDRREQKRDDQICGGLVQYLHGSNKPVRKAGGQAYLFNLVGDRSGRLIERKVGCVVGIHRNLKLPVVSFDSRGPVSAVDRSKIVESNLAELA